MRVALVEDDADVRGLICLWLKEAGFHCQGYGSGAEFRRALTTDSYDLVILDWMLPDTSGDKLLGWLRDHFDRHPPVIIVSARDSEQDIVQGLSFGADDYIPKPVRRAELLARITAVRRRVPSQEAVDRAALELAPFRIDMVGRTIHVRENPVELTHKEFEVACFLFRRIGRIVSRAHLLESVWGSGTHVNTRTVDTHVSRLRTKLGLTPENGWRLSAIYNHGYRLERLDKPAA
jgi:DNA-binding response OmpR family regulator